MAKASDLCDSACDDPSKLLTDSVLQDILRDVTGSRAHLFDFQATLSRLHLRFEPVNTNGGCPSKYDLVFVGTQRCELSVHSTVENPKFTVDSQGLDGTSVTYESNGGDTKIIASDVLVIVQDMKGLFDLETLNRAELGEGGKASPATS